MGTADRKEREREQRQHEILDAAEKVFLKKGFYSATMDDIAIEAELSKGTLYLYFKSKESILVGLDWRGSQILKERFEQAYQSKSTGLDRVGAIGASYFKFVEDYPLYFLIMLHADRRPDEVSQQLESEPIYQKCQEEEGQTLIILAEAIKSGIADKTIDKDINPIETAILLWAMSNGVIQLYHNHGDDIRNWLSIDPKFLYTRFFEFMRGALANKAS